GRQQGNGGDPCRRRGAQGELPPAPRRLSGAPRGGVPGRAALPAARVQADRRGGAGMRVLVTGGTRLTGKALVKRVLDLKHDVVALDYKEGLRTQELREWGAKVVLGSVTDREVVAHAMQGVEVVHHLAAAFREMGVPDTYYYEVNVNGTRNVLDVARAHGV